MNIIKHKISKIRFHATGKPGLQRIDSGSGAGPAFCSSSRRGHADESLAPDRSNEIAVNTYPFILTKGRVIYLVRAGCGGAALARFIFQRPAGPLCGASCQRRAPPTIVGSSQTWSNPILSSNETNDCDVTTCTREDASEQARPGGDAI
ncbi:hypothetical protein EVAR_87912_1 [Eumeta japonica]|uniref:Uncharacterized protein n=1 Tax=Eumeta variegata TaxID=151549 RepID=A0A4C1WTV4_EUMVA|nr:hypothetical protein EVAR_87912_1 [Eumeta japonica]